jgi:hypothetical protein
LGVSARMLQKRGNNFFGACDFKGLAVAKRSHLATSTR